MKFSEQTIQKAWKRSGGKCECNRNYHTHKIDNQRCDEVLLWEKKESAGVQGGWAPHHKVPFIDGGQDEVENCEILCHECFKASAAYWLF